MIKIETALDAWKALKIIHYRNDPPGFGAFYGERINREYFQTLHKLLNSDKDETNRLYYSLIINLINLIETLEEKIDES